jgi:hypothetical protein
MLVLRCDRCRTAVWLTQENPESADCSHCKKHYDFTAQLRGRSMEELHQQVCGLATQLVIDLPSAGSMMLDMLKLTQVQDYLSGDPHEESPEHVEEPSSVVGVDPAFEESIKAGRLGRMEALQRGNREHYATKLISRHGISEDEAYAVADNRELLLAIVRRREAASPRTIVAPLPSRSTWKVALAAAVMGGLVIWGVSREIQQSANRTIAKESTRSAQDRQTRERVATMNVSAAATAEPAPELSFDPMGAMTRISAPRPEAVLRAYCRAPELQPMALASGAIPDKNLWFGLFADMNEPDRNQAVVIRKDRKSGHWVAGDGVNLIQILTPDIARLGEPQLLNDQPTTVTGEGSP